MVCKLHATDVSRIPDKARILLVGDSTTHRAFSLLRKLVGGCREVKHGSQAALFPGGDAGVKSGAGVHQICARGIELWFHAFTKADEGQVGAGMKHPMNKERKIDQFDFSYLEQTLDVVILTIGVHFSYFDADKFGVILDAFLPAIRTSVKSREHWFMSNNRYCGKCFSAGRGFSAGNKPVYLREIQNEARAEMMTSISMAKAAQHGWRPLNQHAITRAIPDSRMPDGVHCKSPFNSSPSFPRS